MDFAQKNLTSISPTSTKRAAQTLEDLAWLLRTINGLQPLAQIVQSIYANYVDAVVAYVCHDTFRLLQDYALQLQLANDLTDLPLACSKTMSVAISRLKITKAALFLRLSLERQDQVERSIVKSVAGLIYSEVHSTKQLTDAAVRQLRLDWDRFLLSMQLEPTSTK